jgi:hypothetical protein
MRGKEGAFTHAFTEGNCMRFFTREISGVKVTQLSYLHLRYEIEVGVLFQ